MSKVALIIIYNHQYNKNIDILEKIYSSRFKNIYHLVPFYNGDKPNVIPVYENSYYFQGYVAQGLKSFYKEEYDHYFFVADDLILNPLINETSYKKVYSLNNETCYLPELLQLHELEEFWSRTKLAYEYDPKVKGVEVANMLPSYEQAQKAFKDHNLDTRSLSFDQIWLKPPKLKSWGKKLLTDRQYIFRKLENSISGKKYNLQYPLVGGYSDTFIISASVIKDFCHYCGIFAATNLFVELALPTAMVLSAKEIKIEKDLERKGFPIWHAHQFKILDKYNQNLKSLLSNFPEELLYIHPIKLSKWNTDL